MKFGFKPLWTTKIFTEKIYTMVLFHGLFLYFNCGFYFWLKESNETCWINYNLIVTKLVNYYVHCYVDCKVGITSSKVGAKLDNVLSSAKVWAKTLESKRTTLLKDISY